MATGCSYNVGYKSTYLPEPASQQKMDAKVLIYTTAEQDAYVYSEHPKSFTASATTLSVPLGEITRQVAVRAFSARFTSVDASNRLDQRSAYRVVVTPRISNRITSYNVCYTKLLRLPLLGIPKIRVIRG